MARIAQIVGDGRPGGGTTAVITLARLLADEGHDVHVLSQQGSYLLEHAVQQGLSAHGLQFTRRAMTPVTARDLSTILNRISPAVAHAHGARAALPMALATRLRMIERAPKFAYTVHGFHYSAKPYALKVLARSAEAACIAQADWTNFVSDADRELASRDGLLRRARSHSTIKNAVSVPPHLSQQPKCFDIGFVGRLTGQKNPLFLRDILSALRPCSPTLAVIGGGVLEAKLREEFRDAGLTPQVTMLGECSRDNALSALSQCRLLVLPSLWEGHPITLIEAMLLGVPAIASDIPGNDEIIVRGQTGHLVPVNDARAYAAQISRLLHDDTLRQRMGDCARRIATAEYSTERMLSGHLEHYGLRS
jgi:glycosyltransferase involved in cell wall biosynthesis